VETRPEWGVTGLSKELRINKSTVSKIVSALKTTACLQEIPKRVNTGSDPFFEVGSFAAPVGPAKGTLALMEELNRKAGETNHLVVMDDFETTYIHLR